MDQGTYVAREDASKLPITEYLSGLVLLPASLVALKAMCRKKEE